MFGGRDSFGRGNNSSFLFDVNDDDRDKSNDFQIKKIDQKRLPTGDAFVEGPLIFDRMVVALQQTSQAQGRFYPRRILHFD